MEYYFYKAVVYAVPVVYFKYKLIKISHIDTGNYWSYFGKSIILVLIQIGGLGFMTFSTFLALLSGRKITLRERLLIQQSLNLFNIQGLMKMSMLE